MFRRRKGETMKDGYMSDTVDISEALAAFVPGPGMRHSIRPRRAVLEQVQRRMMAKSVADPFEVTELCATATPPAAISPATVSLAVTSAEGAAQPEPLCVPAEVATPAILGAPVTPQWDDLELEEAGPKRARGTAMPVADAERDSASARAFDLLRTRLRQVTRENGWSNIAITAPTRDCGNTFTAVNLALSLSRVPGSRTLLMDLNLRHPGLADAFDMTPRGAMRDLLTGNAPMEEHLVRLGDTLAVGLTDEADEGAAEVLQDPGTGRALDRIRAALRPDLVIYDMPPLLTCDDVPGFIGQLDGVLLVSDGTRTTGRDLVECERMLDGQVPLLGVVLNRARRSSLPRG
jgi:protein-tyrosine kinase